MTPQTLAECVADLAQRQVTLDALVGDLLASAQRMTELAEALEHIRDRMRQEAGL